MISLDAIINSLEEAVILFDKTLRIVYLNKTAEEMLRKSSKDIMMKKVPEILGNDRTISPLIRETIREGRSFKGKSASLDIGHNINIDFHLSPFFSNGKIEGAVLSISQNIN